MEKNPARPIPAKMPGYLKKHQRVFMKTILSVLSALGFIICSCLIGCKTSTKEPNEADSVKNICAISIDDCDYDFYKSNLGYGYRIHDKRELYIGNETDGMAYDGESSYQYINGKKIYTTGFTYEKYDAFAQEILETCQQIIKNGYYMGYNDDSASYRFIYYHFRISEEGLALFTDQKYEWGMIDCIYRDGEFEFFDLDLYVTKEASEDFSFTFGTIPYTISY